MILRRLPRLARLSALIVVGVTSGCARRAPSPDECVVFAEMTFGHRFEAIVQEHRAKAVFDRLVSTCLTAPFDRRVFACTNETRAPMDCLRRIQPELFGDQRIDISLPRSGRERF